jgi:hypothetical protein
MILLDRDYGKNYADNIVDYLLSFNEASTWTAASGTGTAVRDVDVVFAGAGSLRINNTAPTTDLVVTNSVQSTAIVASGTYQISAYFRKNEPDEIISGAMLIYKNAVLLATETFSLGSETTADDVNGVWQRFQTNNNYSLIKGDVLTFQFRLDGKVGTLLTDTTLWVDGVMVNAAERENFIVPAYTESINTPANIATGWESKFQATTQSLTGSTDNLITVVGTSESNGGLTLLNASGKVTPIKLGDAVNIDFGCTVVTPATPDAYVEIKFVVDGVVFRSITSLLVKSSGNDDFISLTGCLPVGSSFLSNGLEVYINPSANLDIKDKYIAVTRTHIGK